MRPHTAEETARALIAAAYFSDQALGADDELARTLDRLLDEAAATQPRAILDHLAHIVGVLVEVHGQHTGDDCFLVRLCRASADAIAGRLS